MQLCITSLCTSNAHASTRCLWFHQVLWSEMVGVESVFQADPWQLNRLLSYSEDVEYPVVLQIGGSDPSKVEEAIRRAQVESK